MIKNAFHISEGKISRDCYDAEKDATVQITLTLEYVLTALLGCEDIPSNLETGRIEFDHGATGLLSINTCAPSITFTKVKELQQFDHFQDKFSFALIGSKDFFGVV